MNLNKLLIIIMLSTLTIVSCADQGGPFTKQGVGTMIGTGAGALLGSTLGKGSGKVGAIALGAIGGALLGGSIGHSLDKADQIHMLNTQAKSLETARSGQTMSWHNPDSGHSGSFTPVRTYNSGGRYCREFNQTVNIGGKVQQAYGNACRQPDGTWQIVSN